MWESILKRGPRIGIHERTFAIGLIRVQEYHAGKEVSGKEFYHLLRSALETIIEEDSDSWTGGRKRVSHLAPTRLVKNPYKLVRFAITALGVPEKLHTRQRNGEYLFQIPTKEEWGNPFE